MFTPILRVSFSRVFCSISECVYSNTGGQMVDGWSWCCSTAPTELGKVRGGNYVRKFWTVMNSFKTLFALNHMCYAVCFETSFPTFKLNKHKYLSLKEKKLLRNILWISPETVIDLGWVICYCIDYRTSNIYPHLK